MREKFEHGGLGSWKGGFCLPAKDKPDRGALGWGPRAVSVSGISVCVYLQERVRLLSSSSRLGSFLVSHPTSSAHVDTRRGNGAEAMYLCKLLNLPSGQGGGGKLGRIPVMFDLFLNPHRQRQHFFICHHNVIIVRAREQSEYGLLLQLPSSTEPLSDGWVGQSHQAIEEDDKLIAISAFLSSIVLIPKLCSSLLPPKRSVLTAERPSLCLVLLFQYLVCSIWFTVLCFAICISFNSSAANSEFCWMFIYLGIRMPLGHLWRQTRGFFLGDSGNT